MYIFICIYIHIYIYIYIYIYVNVNVNVSHTHTQAHTHKKLDAVRRSSLSLPSPVSSRNRADPPTVLTRVF